MSFAIWIVGLICLGAIGFYWGIDFALSFWHNHAFGYGFVQKAKDYIFVIIILCLTVIGILLVIN